MVPTARLPTLMFILTCGGSTEALDGWLREFYGDPRALTLDDLAGVIADFDTLLTGPLDSALRASVRRLRDAFANTTTTLSPPPQPVPANARPVSLFQGPGEFDDEVPTTEVEVGPQTGSIAQGQ